MTLCNVAKYRKVVTNTGRKDEVVQQLASVDVKGPGPTVVSHAWIRAGPQLYASCFAKGHLVCAMTPFDRAVTPQNKTV